MNASMIAMGSTTVVMRTPSTSSLNDTEYLQKDKSFSNSGALWDETINMNPPMRVRGSSTKHQVCFCLNLLSSGAFGLGSTPTTHTLPLFLLHGAGIKGNAHFSFLCCLLPPQSQIVKDFHEEVMEGGMRHMHTDDTFQRASASESNFFLLWVVNHTHASKSSDSRACTHLDNNLRVLNERVRALRSMTSALPWRHCTWKRNIWSTLWLSV